MATPPSERHAPVQFLRALGPLEGVAIVVGTTIGSGIFLTPATIAEKLGPYGFGAILGVWVLCGALSLAGALAYAELGALFPRAGGQYVYLREAFGPLWGFLFGWVEFWVARAGGIAAVAVAFARYVAVFTNQGGEWAERSTAFLAICVLTAVNYLGVRGGGAVQTLFTATKVGALLALVICSFGLPGGSAEHWQPLWNPAAGAAGLISAVGFAMVQSLWSYDGWTNGAAVSEEMKNPQRDVPRSLLIGTAIITAIYVSANIAYHYVLPLERIQGSERVAADVAGRLFGSEVGVRLLAAAVLMSTFGAINGSLLSGTRIFYAMARDGLFFQEMGQLHLRFRSPHWSILFQGIWASALVLVPFDWVLNPLFHWKQEARLYDQLLAYVVFASWAFYGLTVAGLFRLRMTQPDLPRPYSAWGYPVVPGLFVLTSGAFVLHTLVSQPGEALAGVAILLLGIPAYRFWARRSAEPAQP
ncbi:MAG: amino acid permease [Armatimonadetes bacterium]|nr:amino acid permease [Armatimonadota bacterium]